MTPHGPRCRPSRYAALAAARGFIESRREACIAALDTMEDRSIDAGNHDYRARRFAALGEGAKALSALTRANDGGYYRVRRAQEIESIAVLARRSACVLSARPTCSKVTLPMPCASTRAFACSGCSPAFFTL